VGGDERDCLVARTFLATISMVRCGGSRAAVRRPRIGHGEGCVAGERVEIRGLDTPDVSGNVLCVRCLRNAHSYTFTLAGTCTCAEAVRPRRDKGRGPIQLQASYTFSRRQLKFRNPPGAHKLKGVGRSVHICTHTHGGCEQSRKG
jgi:hypothetical protein